MTAYRRTSRSARAIIHVVCEVGGVDHAKRLINTLTADGYKVFTSQI